MKKIKFLFLFALVALLGVSCNKDDDIDPNNYYQLTSFEVGVEPSDRMVKILFQVLDYTDGGVPELEVGDFEILENDVKISVESDVVIDPESIPFELKTVLLLDISSSVESNIIQIKDACKALVNSKLDDQLIAVYTFDRNPVRLQDFTTNKADLIEAINSIPETGFESLTNLYGSIIDVADDWEDSYTIETITDGSLIVFTDGRHNTGSSNTVDDAIAQMGSKKRYVAALKSEDLQTDELKKFCGDENYLEAENIEALEAKFLEIQTRIQNLSKSIYYLYYKSTIIDPQDNTLRIRIPGNTNPDSDKEILEGFSSVGFGK